jgi:hypothetical protein
MLTRPRLGGKSTHLNAPQKLLTSVTAHGWRALWLSGQSDKYIKQTIDHLKNILRCGYLSSWGDFKGGSKVNNECEIVSNVPFT